MHRMSKEEKEQIPSKTEQRKPKNKPRLKSKKQILFEFLKKNAPANVEFLDLKVKDLPNDKKRLKKMLKIAKEVEKSKK